MAKAFPTTDRDFDIMRAADTLIEAKRIKKDKKLHKEAITELKRRAKEIKEVTA